MATLESSSRQLAIAAGVFFLITHLPSVPARILYGPVLNNPGWITGLGPDTPLLVGAFLEVICAAAIVGTAVALFPVVKRHNEAGALGYVGLRTLEAGIIAVGLVPILVAVTLRQQAAAGGSAMPGLVTLGSSLVAFNNWTAVVGPGLVCGINTVVMASLLYRSRLVPRFIPVLGLIGGPLVFAYNAAVLFGISDRFPTWTAIAVVPIFAWEVSLAIWLIARGFKLPATTGEVSRPSMSESVGKGLSQA